MTSRTRILLGIALCTSVLTIVVHDTAAETHPSLAEAQTPTTVRWSVGRDCRLLVRVDPVELGSRSSDESVAIIEIEFANYLNRKRADLSSLAVVGYAPDTGEPITYEGNAYADTPGETTSRFYDASIPWEFPDYYDYVNFETEGVGRFKTMTAGGRLYGTVGDGAAGRLVWAHRQRGDTPSYYAIYFDVLPDGAPVRRAPEGFVGDGGQRCEKQSSEFAPVLHGRVTTADLNGDGLFDIVLGNAAGTLLFYENTGQPGSPKFQAARLLFDTEGRPIDVGWSSAPKAVDWDRDGDYDLIVGAEKEAFLLYRNIGDKRQMSFQREGLVKIGDKPLRVPRQPSKEDPTNSIYPYDYYPVPEVVDWDGDGDLDLLAGGYITGAIYLYENIAQDPKSEPELAYRGPLTTDDGAVLDVTWCAAPTVADFDGDGDLDLISGAMQMTEGGGDKVDPELFLWYYENVGTRSEPMLKLMPFPAKGRFAHGALGSPRAIDFNGDGLLDLIVSCGGQLFLYPNVGSATQPMFDAETRPLGSLWGRVSITHRQMIDINGDSWPDLYDGSSIRINTGKGSPGVFLPPVPLPGAEKIFHPVQSGDNWDYRILSDLDGDGDDDILSGDHGGYVWLHQNTGSEEYPAIDSTGVKLKLNTGDPIKVGLPPEGATSFDVLQGARTALAALDYNRDGRMDLVICDTYGYVRLYVQADGDDLQFDVPIEIARLHEIRAVPAVLDWNNDGWEDILVSYAGGQIYALLNQASSDSPAPFAAGEQLHLPPGIGEPLLTVGDWNRDGDDDIMIQDYYFMRFVERSFIEHGYRQAQFLGFEAND
jgi:VCBS repeat protein